jgi:hypothetical protein
MSVRTILAENVMASVRTRRKPATRPAPYKPPAKPDPTEIVYGWLGRAHAFFNERLFARERLPKTLFTINRRAGVYGYYSPQRFGRREGTDVVDEIGINPTPLRTRSTEEVLSTVLHEMVHEWQTHFGASPKRHYHNREWADAMEERGLMPSSTGQFGGKRTGVGMSHYIIENGFAPAAAEFISQAGELPYVDLIDEGKRGRGKDTSKTKYACPQCEQAAWGAHLEIDCRRCGAPMLEAA